MTGNRSRRPGGRRATLQLWVPALAGLLATGVENPLRWVRADASIGTALAAPARAEANRIAAVKVGEDGSVTTVVITGSGTPAFSVFKLEQPLRLVIDVSNAVLGSESLSGPVDAQSTWAVSQAVVSGVTGDQGGRARIVLAFRRPADYSVQARGSDLVVTVRPYDAKPAAPAAVATTSKAADRALREETDRALKRAADAERAAKEANAQAARERADAEIARRQAVLERTDAERKSRELEAKRSEAERRALAVEARQSEAERRTREVAVRESEADRRARETSEAAERRGRDIVRQAEERSRQLTLDAERVRAEAEQTRQAATVAAQKELEGARKDAERLRRDAEGVARAESERRAAQAARDAKELGFLEERLRFAVRAREDAEKAAIAARIKARDAERKAQEAVVVRAREEERARATAAAVKLSESRREALDSQLREEEARKQALVAARANEELLAQRAASARTEAEERRAIAELALKRTESARQAADVAGQKARTESERTKATQLAQAREQAEVESRRAVKSRAEAEAEAARTREAHVLARAQVTDEESRLRTSQQARVREEQRLRQAQEARAQEETRLAALRAERERLERTRPNAELVALASRAAAAAQPAPEAQELPPPRTLLTRSDARPEGARRAPVVIQDIQFIDEPGRSSVVIDLARGIPPEVEVLRQNPRTAVLVVPGAMLDREAQTGRDTTEYLGPVRGFEARADRVGVRVRVDLAESVPATLRKVGSKLYFDFAKGKSSALGGVLPDRAPILVQTISPRRVALFQARPLGRAGSKKRYTGRRIDLDFKDADIHNLLRLLSDVGQINIITDSSVGGSVTLRLRNVPWDQALDLILKVRGYGMTREGNLLRVAPQAVLDKEREAELAARRAQIEMEPLETRLIPLSYAQGGEMAGRIGEVLSPRGRVSVDGRTNYLIVTDVRNKIDLAQELVNNLDTQTAQVLIEARIVEANTSFSRQFGIQWGFDYIASAATGNPTGLVWPSTVAVAGGTPTAGSPTTGLLPAAAQSPNFVINMPAAAGAGAGAALGFTFGSLSGNFNTNLRLSALETTGNIRTLSAPRIQTLDNQAATITQGRSIPISQVSAAGVNTVFVQAATTLSVTPKVTNEGTVMLNISVTRNEPDFGNTGARGDPSILTKSANTNMLVKDGDTAVIGGIYSRVAGTSWGKVPFFSDIPILGWLFKTVRETDDRSELLIFITPRVVNRARSIGQ